MQYPYVVLGFPFSASMFQVSIQMSVSFVMLIAHVLFRLICTDPEPIDMLKSYDDITFSKV